MLTDAEMAYMREVQAEARPTTAQLGRRTQKNDGTGGRTNTTAPGVPVQVRLDGREQGVPDRVVAVVGSAKAVKVTMDLVDVRSGDTLTIGQDVYEVVTDGDPDEWATAQVVWAKRVKAPPRG